MISFVECCGSKETGQGKSGAQSRMRIFRFVISHLAFERIGEIVYICLQAKKAKLEARGSRNSRGADRYEANKDSSDEEDVDLDVSGEDEDDENENEDEE